MRRDPIYHSTYTGKPPDEPAVLGVALNEVFVPLLQKQFPEIADFYLPPEGCSYRLAVVSLKKQYPGHAKRVMFGVWSFLRQFMYTKIIVVTDDDVDIRDWKDVIWALTTRVDPGARHAARRATPIDYLDFASPVAGLGSKMGIDATNKWPGETTRDVGPADRDGRGGQGARRRAVGSALRPAGRRRPARATPRGRRDALPAARDPHRGERERPKRSQRASARSAGERAHETDQQRRRPAATARCARRAGAGATIGLDFADGEHDPRAVELGARREQRLALPARWRPDAGLTLSPPHLVGEPRAIALELGQRRGERRSIGRAALPESATARRSRSRDSTIVNPQSAAMRYVSQNQTTTSADAASSANAKASTITTTRTRLAIARARSSSNSTEASSSRVRNKPDQRRAEVPQRAAQAAARPSGRAVGHGGEASGAAVHQQADDETDRGGDADRLPRIVVHVVVGGAGGGLGAVDRLAFEFLQPELGAQQLGLDLRAQVAGLVAGFDGAPLQHFLGFGQHARQNRRRAFRGYVSASRTWVTPSGCYRGRSALRDRHGPL